MKPVVEIDRVLVFQSAQHTKKSKENFEMFSKQNVTIKGSVDQRFESVKEIFEENFSAGDEISAQLCVVQRGKIVRTYFSPEYYLIRTLPAYMMRNTGSGRVGVCE